MYNEIKMHDIIEKQAKQDLATALKNLQNVKKKIKQKGNSNDDSSGSDRKKKELENKVIEKIT